MPEAWFTNNGIHGPGYFSLHPTDPNAAIYFYLNAQQSMTLWFHDHTLGITREMMYSGLAAFYFVRDQFDTERADNPLSLPADGQEIELMIQDRQFDTNGQLLWPDSANNPSLVDGPPSNPQIHPFWIPEFFGDTMLVNGKSWPFLNVQPRRYRFRVVSASNARFLRMGLVDAASGAVGPPMFQIGTDGGLLDAPVKLLGQPGPVNNNDPSPTTRLFLAPSERADIIIDFANQQEKSFTLTNDAPGPVPERLAAGSGRPDPADHAVPSQAAVLRPRQHVRPGQRRPATPRAEPGARHRPPGQPKNPTLAAGVTPSVTRQLVLFEFEAPTNAGGNTAGTPVEDLVNDTKWNGTRDGGRFRPIPGSTRDQSGQGIFITELPRRLSRSSWKFTVTAVRVSWLHSESCDVLLGRVSDSLTATE